MIDTILIVIGLTVLCLILHRENKKAIHKPNVIEQEKIDLNHNTYDCKLFARKLWNTLCPAYIEYGDLNDMDSFLCDLRLFEIQFQKSYTNITFYWSVCGSNTIVTEEYDILKGNDCVYVIRFGPNFPYRRLDIKKL